MRFARFLSALFIVIVIQVGIYLAPHVLGASNAEWIAAFRPVLNYAVPIVFGLAFWKVKGGIGQDVTKVATGLFILDLVLLTVSAGYLMSAAARADSMDTQDIVDQMKKDFSDLDQWILEFFRLFIPGEVEEYEQQQQRGTTFQGVPGPPSTLAV